MTVVGDGWRERAGTLPERLAAELRDAIATGVVAPGSPLPSERRLSAEAQVSRTTANLAVDILVASRWATRRDRSRPVATVPDGRAQSIAPERNGRGLDLVAARVAAPIARFDDALARAQSRLRPHLLGDGRNSFGLDELREVVAERFDETGLPTKVEQVVITNGAMGALGAILEATVGAVVVEDPSYHVAIRMFGQRRRRTVPWARGGAWDREQLDRLVRTHRPALAYLVPDFHNPTGALASESDRHALDGIGASITSVVVDETLRDLDLSSDGPMPGHLAAFVPEAFTIGGLSKTVWSGLRIGWLRLPDGSSRAEIARYSGVQPVALLDQLIAVELWPSIDEIVGERAGRLRTQRDALVAAARRVGFAVDCPSGGLVGWVDLGRPVAAALARRLDTGDGPTIAPGTLFGVSSSFDRFVRIPFTHDASTLTAVIERLAALIEEGVR